MSDSSLDKSSLDAEFKEIQNILETLLAKDIQVQNTIQKFEHIFNTTSVCSIIYLEKDKTIIDVNKTAMDLLGIKDKREYLGKQFTFIDDSDNIDKKESFLNKRSQIRDINGNYIRIIRNKTVVTPINSEPYVIEVFFDVSYIVKETELRREKEKLLTSILETTNSGIFFAVNGMIYWINSALADLLGYHTNELIGQKVSKLFLNEEIYRKFRDSLYQLDLVHNKIEQEISFKTSEDEEKRVIISASFLNPKNKNEGSITSITDLENILETREKLILNRSILKALLNTFPFPTFIINKKDNIVLSNNEFKHIFGTPHEDGPIKYNIQNNDVDYIFGEIHKEEQLENRKIISIANDEMYFDIIKTSFIYEDIYIGTLIILLNSGDKYNNELLLNDLMKIKYCKE